MSKKLIGLLGLITIVSLFSAPIVVAAADEITISEQFPGDYTSAKALKILPTILSYVYGTFLVIVVLMIIVAGYMFVTGGGNPETIGKARNMLMYALVGLAVAVVARGLIALVAKFLDTSIEI
jgi:type IV secretory pathway VirB2 component (pilin)